MHWFLFWILLCKVVGEICVIHMSSGNDLRCAIVLHAHHLGVFVLNRDLNVHTWVHAGFKETNVVGFAAHELVQFVTVNAETHVEVHVLHDSVEHCTVVRVIAHHDRMANVLLD